MEKLRLTEIFFSLQGETRFVGLPTVFIRLTGCPLRCGYCDTAYAFQGGQWHTFSDILKQIQSYQTRYITVTGGEPLAQKAVIPFLKLLCDQDYSVSLETSGALDVSEVDPRVNKIVDLKTPGSGECEKNLYANIDFLNPNDEIKFVICDRQDYDWAKTMIIEKKLTDRCPILFSPSYQQVNPNDLADWILADQLPVRFQLQLHKVIWGDVPGK